MESSFIRVLSFQKTIFIIFVIYSCNAEFSKDWLLNQAWKFHNRKFKIWCTKNLNFFKFTNIPEFIFNQLEKLDVIFYSEEYFAYYKIVINPYVPLEDFYF